MLRRRFDSSGKTPVELYHSRNRHRETRRARTVTARELFCCLCLAPLQNKPVTVRNVRMDTSEVFAHAGSV